MRCAAVAALNSCQTSAAILEEIRRSGNLLNLRSIPEMREYLACIGYKMSDLDSLNIIHIAGTKGKGSTSAMCDSILRQCSVRDASGANPTRPLRTGLFTSPHLVEVRERIRIDGAPLSRVDFARHFGHVWSSFEAAPSTVDSPFATRKGNDKPNYFRFLFLVACRAFLEEK
ncbi:Folylpolyglutamate synthetase, partial [Cladochytrium tenue]